jgi:hypothetical protein
MRQLEICPLVWCVPIWDFWFQPPCLCETRSRWMDGGGGVIVWGCFAGDTVSDLFRIQCTLNQHYAAIFGTIICFLTGQWPNTPPGCVRAIWPRMRVMECCLRWRCLHNHPTSTKLRWFGMSWTTEWRKSNQQVLSICEIIPGEAGWENAKSAQNCH